MESLPYLWHRQTSSAWDLWGRARRQLTPIRTRRGRPILPTRPAAMCRPRWRGTLSWPTPRRKRGNLPNPHVCRTKQGGPHPAEFVHPEVWVVRGRVWHTKSSVTLTWPPPLMLALSLPWGAPFFPLSYTTRSTSIGLLPRWIMALGHGLGHCHNGLGLFGTRENFPVRMFSPWNWTDCNFCEIPAFQTDS